MTERELAEQGDELNEYFEDILCQDDFPFLASEDLEKVLNVNGTNVTASTWRFSSNSTCGFCGSHIPFAQADQVEFIDGSPACVSCFCQLNAL